MIKTPLSTMIGGAFWTPNATILGGTSKTLDQLIKSLFANNEQGFAYDPNDLTTLYQDAAGTVPVTGAGQAVGLVLDKSKGLVLGDNIQTNGDGTTILGWNGVGGVTPTLNDGTVRMVSYTNGVGTLAPITPIQAGKFYAVTIVAKADVNTNLVGLGLRKVSLISTGIELIHADISLTTEYKTIMVYLSTNTVASDIGVFFRFGGAVGINVKSLTLREVSGNHAYQTVSASRPVLTNRVNMFNDSELFSAWRRNDGVPLTTPNPKYPNAVKLTRGAASAYIHRTAMTTTGTYTMTGLFKNVIGTVTAIFANTVAVTMTKVGVTAEGLDIYQATKTITDVPNSSVTGIVLYNANDSVEVYGLDVRVTQQGSTLPLYQKVVGSTQFDSVGFPNYLLFDGVDDFLQTNNIDFTSTDKVSVFAGVRKLSDVNRAMLLELGTSGVNTFLLQAPTVAGEQNFEFTSGTSILKSDSVGSMVAPISAVLTAKADIQSDYVTLILNGGINTPVISDQGIGNYGNYPLYIGRRAGTSLAFNGHLYSLIGIGRLTTDAETIALEKSIAKNTGVTLSV